MSSRRLIMMLVLLAAMAIALSLWTAHEAGLQKKAMEETMHAAVSVVARSLVPSLAAASSSTRELRELLGWKLLDNARLLGRLESSAPLSAVQMKQLREANGLDRVVVLDAGCRVAGMSGEHDGDMPDLTVLAPVCRGELQEYAFEWPEEGSHNLFHVAVAAPGGGAVVVGTEASLPFAGRLGVANLLQRTAGTGNVLYLSFRENDGGHVTEASWDRGPVPRAACPELRGRAVFEVTLPVEGPAGSGGTLRVGLDEGPLRQATTGAVRRTAMVSLVLVALVLATSALALAVRARSSERLESMRRLGDLENQRARSERLASAGALSAGVAHEIRNPLNAISIAAQRIKRLGRDDRASERFSDTILSEVHHMEEILQGFLDLARPLRGEKEQVLLADLAGEVVALLEGEGAERGVSLRLTETAPGVEAFGDRGCLRRAMMNLLRNAIEVSPPGEEVEIVLSRVGDKVRITVRDRGRGMEGDVRERAFDPFFTTRADGSGLGLPLVRRVAEEHGGWAQLLDRKGGGVEAMMEISRGFSG